MAPSRTGGLVARWTRPLSRMGTVLPATTLLLSCGAIFCLLSVSCLQSVSSVEHPESVDALGQDHREQVFTPKNHEISQEATDEVVKAQNTTSSQEEPFLAELPNDVFLDSEAITSAVVSKIDSQLEVAKQKMEAAQKAVKDSTWALASQLVAFAPLLGGSFAMHFLKEKAKRTEGTEAKAAKFKWTSKALAVTSGMAVVGAVAALIMRTIAAKNEAAAKTAYAELHLKKKLQEYDATTTHSS